MIGSASAASLVWNGGESGAWGTAGNWIDSGTGSAPASVPSGNISAAAANTYTLNGHVNITEGSMFNNGNQTIVITNGSSVTLSDATANGTARRFDGVFHIEEGSTLTVGTSYFYGASQIYGTLIVCTQFAPQEGSSLDFGFSGIMKLSTSNTYHGMEGNGRTTSISATLDLGTGSNYEVVRRQLFDLNGVTDFDLNKWGNPWQVTAGTIQGTNGEALTAADGDLVAGADTLGQYKLVLDAKDGLYIDYVAAVPEPATASLSLLGMAVLMMRRRRA
ncbi:PEP-CTERM sorting domain-containing protein [Akkermansia sp.]|uniref:PEP-CTERM sorting domain-containing protein n=1 Tax=Akkermansia sp. TaxID=1872421 RepID=UPI0025B9E225|nr:PEP-CTERM sorting domain-containing protein [Akkermansia sp.]